MYIQSSILSTILKGTIGKYTDTYVYNGQCNAVGSKNSSSKSQCNYTCIRLDKDDKGIVQPKD